MFALSSPNPLVLLLLSVSVSFSTVRASGMWEYEAVYTGIAASTNYAINLANNADAQMDICFSAVSAATAAAIESVEDNCDTANPTDLYDAASSVTIADGTTYRINMKSNQWKSVFNIQFPATSSYAVFAQHMPSEYNDYSEGDEMAMLQKVSDSSAVTIGYEMAKWEYEAVYSGIDSSVAYKIVLANKADATMKICFSNVNAISAAEIERVESNCDAGTTSPTNLTDADPSVTIADGTTYRINMRSDQWTSVFNIQFPATSSYAVFAQHMPSEYNDYSEGDEMAMLQKVSDSSAVTVTTFEDPAHDKASDDKWRDTMLGCFAVWAVTLSGLILIVNSTVWEMIKQYALMFASGTLISTAFCLVLYESTHLITDQSSTESLAAGRWAAMVLIGFLSSPIFRVLLQLTAPSYMLASTEEVIPNDNVIAAEENDLESSEVDLGDMTAAKLEGETMIENEKETEFSILFSMVMGDFFHNFADGIFIGSAFQCDASFAWTMVGITVAHELPQEIGDFSILTGRLGYTVVMALLYNVLSGLSVMLGGIVVCAQNLENKDVGMLLAYGAGNYLYVACVHLFEETKDVQEMILRLLWFCIGTISIGLILLDHEHCSVDSGEGGGGGHHHH